MRDALQEFRDAMHRAGAKSIPPSLQTILGQPVLQWRWAAAAMVAIGLGAIPVYRDAQAKQQAAEEAMADSRLMEQVNNAIERSVPVALSALMGN
jgi:uncharacterized membrane protein